MKVQRAEHAGACYGVQRALDMAEEALRLHGRADTLGPLIHNPQVVADLEARGARVAERAEDVQAGTVVIRSHGVMPQVREQLAAAQAEVVDATCPHVLRAQKAAQQLAAQGCRVLIVGDPGHPEVCAIREYARREGAKVDVVQSAEDIPDDLYDPVGVVVQTTQRAEVLQAVLVRLQERGLQPQVRDTICSATGERQQAAERLAASVDAMVVIGGRNSSNTTRLAEICADACPRTFHVESADELDRSRFAGCESIGVTAGASTPEYQIAEVMRALQGM